MYAFVCARTMPAPAVHVNETIGPAPADDGAPQSRQPSSEASIRTM